MLDRAVKFPDGWLPGSPFVRPLGIAKNATTIEAEDGAPWDKDYINDIDAVFQGAVLRRNIAISGVPDTGAVSDVLDAFGLMFGITHSTIAVAIADTTLKVGMHIATADLASAQRGGGGDYLIKTLQQSIDDGDDQNFGFGNHASIVSNLVLILQPFNGIYNALSYGLIDGASDNSLAIKAMIDADPGEIYVPRGDYTGKGSDLFNIVNPLTIRGAGMGLTNFNFTFSTPAEEFLSVKLNSDNITFEDFTINVTGDNLNAVTMAFNVNSSGHRFTRFELDGSASFDSVDTNLIQGMKVGSAVTVTDVVFTGCRIHGVHFGLFTANNYVGTSSDWTFEGNRFYDNTADDLEFNSDDRATKNWNRIIVNSNHFTDHPSSTGVSFGVGTDSGQDIEITSNTFSDYVGSAVHIESEIRRAIVHDNIINNCKRGVDIQDLNTANVSVQDNIIDGGNGNALDADPNLFPEPVGDPNANSSFGIFISGFGSAPKNCIIKNNTITNCDIGIDVPEGNDNLIAGNNISLCISAGFYRRGGHYNFKDNNISRCKYAIWSFNNVTVSMTIDNLMIDECAHLKFGNTSLITVLNGIKWTKHVTIPNNTVTSVPMFELPTRIWGTSVQVGTSLDDSTKTSTTQSLLTYDGATILSNTNMDFGNGGVALSDPAINGSVGKLNLRIFHSIGVDTDFELTAQMNAVFVFNE